MFTIIMVQLLHRSTTIFKYDEKSKTAAKNIKQNLVVATGLSILFGLGWGIGLTATSSDIKEVTFAFQVLFSIFVGSQGVLIFLFHGIRSPQFRKVWLSVFSLKSKQKAFSLSSKHPKKQSGLSTSSSYNLATLTATGTLPSDSSKYEYNTQNIQLALSLATDSEAGVSTFVSSTVLANPKSFSETSSS